MDANRSTTKKSRPREGESRAMEELDLETVIERARGHDTEALGEIYRRYAGRVFGLCRYILESRENAEDATGEVFLKLQRSIQSYDGSIPFPRWLLRVASNQCIDALRRRRRGQRLFAQLEAADAVLEPVSSEPSPLSVVLNAEEMAHVRDTIARLPQNYRVPLILRYYGELSYDEIAKELGVERNYVAALIFHAKQALRRRLSQRSN